MSIDTSQLPRFSPVVYEQADKRTRQIIDQLDHPQKDHPVFMTLMHDPELERLLSPLVQYLKRCPNLPARHREIAILRIAWLCGVDDQWVNHSLVALASGVTQEEIDRVREGAHAAGWSEAEAAILCCVDELQSSCRLSDDAWSALAANYDKQQIIEFLVLAGNYRLVAYIQNCVGIRPVTGTSPNLPGNHFLFPSGTSAVTPEAVESVPDSYRQALLAGSGTEDHT